MRIPELFLPKFEPGYIFKKYIHLSNNYRFKVCYNVGTRNQVGPIYTVNVCVVCMCVRVQVWTFASKKF